MSKNKNHKLRNRLFSLKTAVAVIAVALLGLTIGSVSLNANAETAAESDQSWGPRDRATFTWAEPAEYVTFNSITDNPRMGDERNFVRVRKADTEDNYRDNIDLEVGQTYEVWIWYHNNAKAKLNERANGGVGIANNVRLKVEQPMIVKGDTSAVIRGIISADNADPKEVWDEAFAYTPSTVLLRYVPNSAVIHNFYEADNSVNGTVLSSEAMFGDSGVYLGYWNDLWGTLPGCNEYAGYVTYRFVVDQAGFEISKTAAKEGDDNFSEHVTVAPGDKITFKLDYSNTGTINQLDITAHDKLPNGFSYIPGTSYFTANFNTNGNQVSDNLFDPGLNLGDYKPGDSMSLTYDVQVENSTDVFPCGDTVVYNEASIATANGTGTDRAEITVHRECTCVTNPELPGCQELPETGPVEVAIATLIIGGIGGAGYYLFATRRNLLTVQKQVSGHTAAHKTATTAQPKAHHVDHKANHPTKKS